MGWPPQVGDLLPRAEETTGVRVKLLTYSLTYLMTLVDQRRGDSHVSLESRLSRLTTSKKNSTVRCRKSRSAQSERTTMADSTA
jgi:hypothetical protein